MRRSLSNLSVRFLSRGVAIPDMLWQRECVFGIQLLWSILHNFVLRLVDLLPVGTGRPKLHFLLLVIPLDLSPELDELVVE